MYLSEGPQHVSLFTSLLDVFEEIKKEKSKNYSYYGNKESTSILHFFYNKYYGLFGKYKEIYCKKENLKNKGNYFSRQINKENCLKKDEKKDKKTSFQEDYTKDKKENLFKQNFTCFRDFMNITKQNSVSNKKGSFSYSSKKMSFNK